MRIRASRLSLTLLTATTALTVAACSSGAAPGQPTAAAKLQVVATTSQLADLARQVAGPDAEVHSLMQPGQSAHSFDPSAAAMLAVAKAGLLISNGAALEPWLDGMKSVAGFKGKELVAADGLQLLAEASHDHSHEEAGHDHKASEGHAADEPSADNHGHTHGDGRDPHIWTDPLNMQPIAQSIAAAMAGSDPGKAAAYSARGATLSASLGELGEWIRNSIDRVPVAERMIVTTHDTLRYFANRFSLKVVGAVMPSLDDQREPTATEMAALIKTVKESGARAVFGESTLAAGLAQAIARDSGVRVFAGDQALYADSLGPAGSNGSTYIASQIHNVRMIQESWGSSALPLSESLGRAAVN